PQYTPWVRRLMQPLMPAWTAWKTDVAEIETHHVETLAKLYHQMSAGKTRLLIAFRHPSPTDPYMLSHLFWRDLPRTARELGLGLGKTHSYFIYDRGIPLWAGGYLSWVFSRLGGVPIQRGKLDLRSLKTARDLLLNGRFPLAVAPEGGNNGHNEVVSPLEPGIAQLAFWCAEDLRANSRSESVVILPVGIQYRYLKAPWKQLDVLLGQLEADSGLDLPTQSNEPSIRLEAGEQAERYQRLYRLAEHLLTMMEGYYSEVYGLNFDRAETSSDPNAQLAERLSMLMNKVLQVAEDYFGLRPKGSVIDRCRRLEQAGWDRIFRADMTRLSPVELGLANRIAAEADLRMWHMRLMESFVAVTGRYVKEHPSADRFAETTLLLRSMASKLKGQPVSRPQLGPQKAIITVGQPIEVTGRLADYKTQRRGAIATLTKDLQTELESLILTD
ncbi:MAG: 1-acyl-sn-glycerol-3-phosphate acyltransferase, partial [Phormidesmis sp.]